MPSTLPLVATTVAATAVVVALVLRWQRRRLTVAARTILPSEVTMGAIWIGPGSGPNGDGDRPDLGHENAVATVRAAIEAGIREIDTAPWYGAGASEERLGRALQELSAESQGVKVVTKVGRLVRSADGFPVGPGFDGPVASRRVVNDYTAAGASRSLEESLSRLGLAAVHGLRVHDPNDNSVNKKGAPGGWVDEVSIANGVDGCVSRLRQMREAGVIGEVSLGMNANREAHQGEPDEVIRLLRGAPAGTFDAALLAGGWNLLSQEGLPAFLECERRGVAVSVAGVFASGLLVGGETYAYKVAPADKVALARRWRALADDFGVPLPAVAIAFASLPACVKKVVLGMATPQQVQQNLAWVEQAGGVTPALFHEAKRRGLLAPWVPLP